MMLRVRYLVPAIGVFLGVFVVANAAPPTAGVLLLDNQRVLQGQIELRGDHYVIRRDGGETLIPATRVLVALPDIEAAYRYLREKTDPQDADARLRLACWCDANGLRTQAAAESKAAAELAPSSAVVQAAYQQFQAKAKAPPPKPVEPPPPAKLPTSVVAAAESSEPVECGADAYKRFAAKVQPVLINACASCHAKDYAGKFHLEPVFPDTLSSRPATQHNLGVALAAIDKSKPAASALLQRAITAHGGAALPPLHDRDAPAYKQLDEWVKMTLSDGSPPPVIPAAPGQETAVSGTATPSPEGASDFGAAKTKPPAPTGPKDPFDPAIFNQQNHPEGPKPGG